MLMAKVIQTKRNIILKTFIHQDCDPEQVGDEFFDDVETVINFIILK